LSENNIFGKGQMQWDALNMVGKTLSSAIISAIAAIYAVATVMLGSFGYSWIQVRISEALTPLPYILGVPAIFGLTLGVVISNAFSPVGLPDLVFGPLLTLAAAILSYRVNFGRKMLACVYPVVINGLGVSAYVSGFYNVPYLVCVLTIGVGETISAVLVGYPLLCAIERIVSHLTAEKNGSAKGACAESDVTEQNTNESQNSRCPTRSA
jgi:uncharacterized membrane protein